MPLIFWHRKISDTDANCSSEFKGPVPTIILALTIVLIKQKYQSGKHKRLIPTSTKNFSLFVAIAGVLAALYPRIGSLVAFFSFTDAIAIAVDSSDCFKGSLGSPPLLIPPSSLSEYSEQNSDISIGPQRLVCQEAAALTVFMWLGTLALLCFAPFTHTILRQR